MLANPIFLIINLNLWSKILTRTSTINPNLIQGQYNCVANVPHKIDIMKNTQTTEENYKLHLIDAPSTSGSRSRSSNYDVEKSSSRKQSNRIRECRSEQNISNLRTMNSVMVMRNIPSTTSSVNYYRSNNIRFDQSPATESLRKRNCYKYHIDKNGSIGSTSAETKDKELLALRRWEKITNHRHDTKPGFVFTLMCYNVLAQDLVKKHPYLYSKHNQEDLSWKKRWHNLFSEIKKSSPDLLCLQEVQESHIKDYFSSLEVLGYAKLYKRRTGIRTDGCALYYKRELIKLVEYTGVEYYQPNTSILNRDNVGIIAKFVPRLYPNKEFVIATTHLLYNPKRQDVRLAQIQVLLTEIERLSYCPSSRSGGRYLPVIITGDLNSTPDSALYSLITNGRLNYEYLSPRSLMKGTNMFTGKVLVPPDLRITDNCQHADLLEKRQNNEKTTRSEEISLIELFNSGKQIAKQCKRKEIDSNLFSTGTLSHNFAFKSVYNHGKPENNEGTTFQNKWITVDYIFYSVKKNANSDDKLKLLARYKLPTKNDLNGVRIPNNVLGSDHLALLAKFKLEC